MRSEKEKQKGEKEARGSDSVVTNAHPTCSGGVVGYHVCLTRIRSRVRSSSGVFCFLYIYLFFFCQSGRLRTGVIMQAEHYAADHAS